MPTWNSDLSVTYTREELAQLERISRGSREISTGRWARQDLRARLEELDKLRRFLVILEKHPKKDDELITQTKDTIALFEWLPKAYEGKHEARDWETEALLHEEMRKREQENSE